MIKLSTKCPYNCSDGRVFNVALKQFVPCPHCMEKRKEQIKTNTSDVDEKSLCEVLNIRKPLTGLNLDFDSIFPEELTKGISKESKDSVKGAMQKLTDDVIIGEIPKSSLYFGLTNFVNVDSYVYQLLLKAYKAGLSVAPSVTGYDVSTLRLATERGIEQEALVLESKLGCEYKDLISKDICVVTLDLGSTYFDVDSVIGLMQLRSRRGLPTVIFSYLPYKYVKFMVHTTEVETLHIAKGYFLVHNMEENTKTRVDERGRKVEDRQVYPDNEISFAELSGIISF